MSKSLVGTDWVSTISTPYYYTIGTASCKVLDVSTGDVFKYTTHDGSRSIHVLTGVVVQTYIIQDLMGKSK